jgi:phosphotransferase system enzyme I (PtsI)
MMNREGKETILKGTPLSEGYAAARVCMFNEKRHSNLPQYRVTGEGVPREVERVKVAIGLAGQRLTEIRDEVQRKIGQPEAEIFVAQKMILEDPALFERIQDRIRSGSLNAETSIAQVFDAYEARLLEVDNEYIKERATDFGEVKRRLLDVLADTRPSVQCGHHQCQKGRNRIIVAEELTPSMAVDLDAEHIMGFATEKGGRTSHAAILARALNVPSVSGLEKVRDRVHCGMEILVNGYTGEVVLNPSEATIHRMRSTGEGVMRMPPAVKPTAAMRVMANISVERDVKDAVQMEAEGIGLYRTEIEVIAAGRLFTEEEFYERYASVRRAMPGHPVVYRMLDIGSDKPLPSIQLPAEDNPALGWRGARLLLAREDLFTAQARALARVSQIGPVDVMYPMVVDVEQFLALKQMFEKATADIRPGSLRHGVMFEVPSACLDAEAILGEADFGSIGTNDLIQYLFAVDRGNERVAADFRSDQPVLWQVLEGVASAARRAGKPVSVCGEMAGNPEQVLRLLAIGIRSVSVSARRIPGVRMAVAASEGARAAE